MSLSSFVHLGSSRREIVPANQSPAARLVPRIRRTASSCFRPPAVFCSPDRFPVWERCSMAKQTSKDLRDKAARTLRAARKLGKTAKQTSTLATYQELAATYKRLALHEEKLRGERPRSASRKKKT
jgi:hypothetical protein